MKSSEWEMRKCWEAWGQGVETTLLKAILCTCPFRDSQQLCESQPFYSPQLCEPLPLHSPELSPCWVASKASVVHSGKLTRQRPGRSWRPANKVLWPGSKLSKDFPCSPWLLEVGGIKSLRTMVSSETPKHFFFQHKQNQFVNIFPRNLGSF